MKHVNQKIPPMAPRVTHGFSKDHRPDLKQFMTELLCVERGVPIFGKTLGRAPQTRQVIMKS